MVKNEKYITIHSGVFAEPGNELQILMVHSLLLQTQWLLYVTPYVSHVLTLTTLENNY